ncbi:MAG: hypothetical protein H6Q76_2319 [Firmicutes bacterium]|nr:hypothetical protein [Bacillota bacterium]
MKAKIKLFLWFITISIIPLLIMGGFSYYLISAKISRQYEENINNINMGIYNMVDTQQKVLMQWMDSSATAFSEKLHWLGPIRFDHSTMVDIGGYKLPTWYIGNQKITGDNTLVDILISKQKLPATLFQLHDNKFIRVSSNVRQPDGNRIVGTIVDSGPIYEKIINGQVWRGRGSVEGIMHGMIYQPIFDSSNNLVGAFVLGRREQEFELLSAIKNIVVGETGFVAVMDPEGVFIIHPTLQGKSAASFSWAQEILRKKNGSVTYTDSNGREKIAYYKYYEPWNWYIITGSFVSEIFNTTRELFQGLLLLCLVVIMLSAGIAYAMSITFFRPIEALIEVMKQVRKGNLTVKLHHTQNDEYMVVATALNDMLDTISLLIGRLVNNSNKLKEASLNLIDDITDSKHALTVMETGVDSIRESVQLSHQLAEGDNDPTQELLADIEEIKAYIVQIKPENPPLEASNSLQLLTEMVEGLRHKFLAQAAIDHNINIPFTLQNKINNLDIELAKLQLLTKHISSSANSLDEIALSLDKNVNIFKLDMPGKTVE